MKNAEEIWEQILEGAAPLLPNQTVDIWLKSCSPLRMEDDRLVLDAGNSFVAKKVKDSFLATLESVMQRKGKGSGIDLVYDSKPVGAEEALPSPQPHSPIGSNGLNRQYDFTSFVVGKSNRLAHAASLAVAESPGEAYNPLFIWGGVGLGKTHLMHAIGNYAQGKNGNTKVTYLSSEKFTNELITAIKNARTAEFRAKYRHVDILLIDDIQFLAGKESTQDEFFHTFNDLHTEHKQIVLSSDRPPKELGDIEDRIISRFEWGLVTDIQQPDYETRIAILKKKAEQRRIPVNDDVIGFLAENIPSNIRELEGALNRVIASANFSQEPITIENTQEWLKDVIGSGRRGPLTFQSIMDVVSSEFGFSPEDICSKRRTAEVALARQVAMYMCRIHTESSLQQIAKDFGKKDHTTVLHALKKIEMLMKEDTRVKKIVENIDKKL
ncbi:chromosomal replication initiator protein DnaA [Pyramidobacter piscolens]|uniref:chromosomal replication initiator protein DnaA n=1 Tax=Pyramidobacter piscolens TaxID=638849 RepID=UPI0028E1A5D0|nr:chromosomal replication initiator protein DnaA [Pyramidobacter piscolens]